MKISWRETLIIACISFLCYFLLGAYIDLYRGYIPGDSLSRLVSAWLVFHGTEVKFSSIGFIWPPLPVIVLIPLTLISSLFANWLAVVVVSALAMSIACVLLAQIAALLGIPTWWRWLIVLAFATNPLMIVFGANGMSEAILIAATMAAFYWLFSFWLTNRNTHLIFAAGLFGLLPLIRYEFALVSAWSGLLILLLSWEKRSLFSREKFSQFLEGRLLAYSSLAIYPIFLWTIANWFIMGNPLYFLTDERNARSLAEVTNVITNPILTTQGLFGYTFGIWFLTFPLEMLASVLLFVLGWRKKSIFLVSLGVTPLLIPALHFYWKNIPLLRYLVMVIPLGVLLSLVIIYLVAPAISRFKLGKPLLNFVFVALILLSNFMTLNQLQTYQYQSFEKATWLALTGDIGGKDSDILQASAIGAELVKVIPPGSRVLMDTYGYGFAIFLGAQKHDIFMDFTDPDYNEALVTPQAYVDYILIPKPIISIYETRGSLYAINKFQPTLYDKGAPWAETVDILPETHEGWKLIKVKRIQTP
jgi:hypothetical protein